MLYEAVLKLCKENNMTVSALERELKLSNATIRRWKTASPTIANVMKVANFFGVTIDDLVHKRV